MQSMFSRIGSQDLTSYDNQNVTIVGKLVSQNELLIDGNISIKILNSGQLVVQEIGSFVEIKGQLQVQNNMDTITALAINLIDEANAEEAVQQYYQVLKILRNGRYNEII